MPLSQHKLPVASDMVFSQESWGERPGQGCVWSVATVSRVQGSCIGFQMCTFGLKQAMRVKGNKDQEVVVDTVGLCAKERPCDYGGDAALPAQLYQKYSNRGSPRRKQGLRAYCVQKAYCVQHAHVQAAGEVDSVDAGERMGWVMNQPEWGSGHSRPIALPLLCDPGTVPSLSLLVSAL